MIATRRGDTRSKNLKAGVRAYARSAAIANMTIDRATCPSAQKISMPSTIHARIAIGISRLRAHLAALSEGVVARNLLKLLLSKGIKHFYLFHKERPYYTRVASAFRIYHVRSFFFANPACLHGAQPQLAQ